jgi:hypothetical protein
VAGTLPAASMVVTTTKPATRARTVTGSHHGTSGFWCRTPAIASGGWPRGGMTVAVKGCVWVRPTHFRGPDTRVFDGAVSPGGTVSGPPSGTNSSSPSRSSNFTTTSAGALPLLVTRRACRSERRPRLTSGSSCAATSAYGATVTTPDAAARTSALTAEAASTS